MELDAPLSVKNSSRVRTIDDCESFHTSALVFAVSLTGSALHIVAESVVYARLTQNLQKVQPTDARFPALLSYDKFRGAQQISIRQRQDGSITEALRHSLAYNTSRDSD